MDKAKQLTLEDIPEFIFGFEGEGDDSDEGNPDADGDEGDEGDDGDDPDDSDGDDHDDADDDAVKGLKSALAKEREAAKDFEKKFKQAERERKRLAKAAEAKDKGEKGEVEETTEKLTAAEEKLQRVAKGYLDNKLNAAITKAAEKAGFIDPEDALAGVDRTDLADQDDDDPSDIDIDEAEITSRVKKLATKKPHFLKKGTSDDEPSGSQFGGGKNRKVKPGTKEAFKEAYPNL